MTPHLQETWALISQGKSNKEIATILGLSIKTIKSRVTLIFRAIGVSNRTQAAIAWHAARETTAPEESISCSSTK